MSDTKPNDSSPALDVDEQRLLAAFRRARTNKYGQITAKIHHERLVAIETTERWHVERLREGADERS